MSPGEVPRTRQVPTLLYEVLSESQKPVEEEALSLPWPMVSVRFNIVLGS